MIDTFSYLQLTISNYRYRTQYFLQGLDSVVSIQGVKGSPHFVWSEGHTTLFDPKFLFCLFNFVLKLKHYFQHASTI